MNKCYLMRHCEAEGQAGDAPLTEKGMKQAELIADFFSAIHVDRIISSPFKRAVQSIVPFTEKAGITLETDERLTERVLSTENLLDWLEKLEASFEDMGLRYAGGESSLEAMKRIIEVLEEIDQSDAKTSVVVTHGNLLTLALKYYDREFGFGDWRNLSNPDIFLLQVDSDRVVIQRVWEPVNI
ncbi:histidine phosphatase family protein [Sporosarcina jeotgali]|uniref:Histidine phosphatase family protein n=1 Tax=Sporosarcina jeotgali TaxID=3020056 RepID=A0ABZ0L0R4_9BACL|nr:histidine phosphatase family protein [Sporosarcina sp. B2O-1]WOV85814.1 histidine phosphatase family protein [Sporosarcina sp. B2O-1]